MPVTSSRLEKISGIRWTPTFSEPACRNGPLLNAGSSLMEIWLADAPPLNSEAESLPIWPCRFKDAERLFSRLGRKLSTLINKGIASATTIRTATTMPTIVNRRFITQKCYQKVMLRDAVDRVAGLPRG